MTRKEEILQERVANYLVQNYPDVLFHSDYGSGANLTMGQAVKQKRLNGGRKSWPDIFIAKPYTKFSDPSEVFSGGHLMSIEMQAKVFHGLFIELKSEDEKLYAQRNTDDPKKHSIDGNIYASEHIREQADMLQLLRAAGYRAQFAVGYNHAISIIKAYLGAPRKQEVEF